MRSLTIRCLALMFTLGIMGMIRGDRLAMAQMNGMQPAAATSTESNETQIARCSFCGSPGYRKRRDRGRDGQQGKHDYSAPRD
jgi:hypothetical protein